MATGNIIWVSASAAAAGNGSNDNPFATIQRAIDLATPGTTIMVAGGTYVENLRLRSSGTSDAPISIVSADGFGKAIVKPATEAYDTIAIGGYDHITIDGLTIHAPKTSTMSGIAIYARTETTLDPASYVTISNSTLVGGLGDCIKGSKAEYVSLINNTIRDKIGGEESAIDFVGVNHSRIVGNTITNSANIGIVVKGGSTDVDISDNKISVTGSSGIEVGGYTVIDRYWPGFVGSQTYEVSNVRVINNEITGTAGAGIRFIGAQNVRVSENEISGAGTYAVSIDDSSKYHEVWFSNGIDFVGNSLDVGNWLKNRSAGNGIHENGNFTDGRDLDAPVVPSSLMNVIPTPAAATPLLTFTEPPVPPRQPGMYQVGRSHNDTLTGASKADTLVGCGGDDNLWGVGGNDFLSGGDGKDKIDGGNGQDKIYGGKGNDDLRGGTGNDAISGGTGSDRIRGEDGNDAVNGHDGDDVMDGGKGDDVLVGGSGADGIDGGTGKDSLWGDSGNDKLNGGDGDDLLEGGSGVDNLIGGSGADWIAGGPGEDVLKGGAGHDHFVFRGDPGADKISDFSPGEDTIVVDIEGVESFSQLVIGLNPRGEAFVSVILPGPDLVLATLESAEISRITSHDFLFA